MAMKMTDFSPEDTSHGIRSFIRGRVGVCSDSIGVWSILLSTYIHTLVLLRTIARYGMVHDQMMSIRIPVIIEYSNITVMRMKTRII